jgi:hypothetical protein
MAERFDRITIRPVPIQIGMRPRYQNALENALDNVAPQRASLPVIARGNGPDCSSQTWRHDRPQQNEIQMARMVGEIDPLGIAWAAADPPRLGPGEEFCARCNEPGGRSLDGHFVLAPLIMRVLAHWASIRRWREESTMDGLRARIDSIAESTHAAFPESTSQAATAAALRE